MSNAAKKYLIVVGLLLLTTIITFGAYSPKSYAGKLYTQDIPIIIGNWYGKDLPMDKRTYDILETKDALMRKYVNSNNESMLLTVVFSQNNRKVAHPPEVCLSGGGWSRTDKGIDKIEIANREVKANILLLQKGQDKQIILYLYKAGNSLTHNYYAQQLNIILNAMFRKDTSSSLIRISSSIFDDNGDKATIMTKKFAKEVIPILTEKLP